MRTVRARAVWTGDVLLNDACVVLDGATVRDVRPAGRGDPAPMDGLLSPGFVNAHGHLEFAWVEGQVGGGAGLAAWVRALGQVQASSAQRQAEGLAAARAMAATGTALCSDVSNRGDTAPWLVEAGLVGVVQHELLGFGRDGLEALVAEATRPDQRLDGPAGPVWTRPAPHGLYSTPPALLTASSRRGAVSASIHFMEDPAERELLAHGTGPLADLLDALGVDWRWWRPPACGPATYLKRLGLLGPDLLLVHGVHLDDEDRAEMAAAGASLCLCPRSNLHIGGVLPDVPALIEAGVRLCVGTDSLGSAPDLDVVADISVLARAFPQLPQRVWLAALTSDGADALGVSGMGRLAQGAAPGLVFLEGWNAFDSWDGLCTVVVGPDAGSA